MNVLYLSLSYVPSRRASSMHVMRMCAAMSRAGHTVKLVAKRSAEPTAAGLDDHTFYGVANTFPVHKLARPQRRGGGVVFAAGIVRTLLAERATTDLVYCRDVIGAVAAVGLGMPTIFEAHAVPHDRRVRALTRWLVKRPSLRGLVAISDALRRDLATEGMVPDHAPIIVAHDAADPPPPLGERSARHPPRIGYVGNLYAGRGVELVVELGSHLPDCAIEIVGGNETDLATWRARQLPPNIRFVGFVPPGQLAERYRSFDVLLMPHAKHDVRAATGSDISRWTSPMKMFEYMASGTPIVASDLPVLGEVLQHERNALIAPAGDVERWSTAVKRLVSDRALAHQIATTAYGDLVREHTWDARVRRILGGVSQL